MRCQVQGAAARLLDVPTDIVTACARLIFASVATFAVAVEGIQALDMPTLTTLLLGYNLVAATLLVHALLAHPAKPMPWVTYSSHSVDIIFSTVLITLSQGVASPFFVFFQFTLIVATLRWEWRGALATAGLLTLLLWVVYWSGVSPPISAPLSDEDDLTRALLRGGSLLVSGAMLAYLGAYRDHSRQRLAKLAAWPSANVVGDKLALLRTVLAYSADVMRASRLVVIWDEEDEPHRHVALWADGQIHYSRENTELFGPLLASGRENDVIVVSRAGRSRAPAASRDEPLIDRRVVETFAIESAASAPFSTSACRGRVFALDRTFWSEDDQAMISLIAARIGLSLEEHLLRDRLTAGAALQERIRLGRDLHDGILQGLAAATMQLKVISATAPGGAQDQLGRVRAVLADEVQRIRSFVDQTRAPARPTTGLVRLKDDLEPRISRLRELWPCQIDLTAEPPDVSASLTTARNIGHMVAEAVSNAVRHGKASQVDISIERVNERITLRIDDNGRGFKSLTTPLEHVSPVGTQAGPLSLKSRIEDLGGRFFLTSSDQGTSVIMQLPA